MPPVADAIGWSSAADRLFVWFDYAGLADQWIVSTTNGGQTLGTTISGSVTERPLADGRAEVQIIVQTQRALVWAIAAEPDGSFNVAGAPTVFGRRAPDALSAGEATLGECQFQVKLINPAPGMAIPDLVDAFILGAALPGQELVSLSFRGRADGALQAASGYPQGTPARLTVVQTGLFMTGFHGAVGDGFPAERIRIAPVGN